jgi:hypothetical protein
VALASLDWNLGSYWPEFVSFLSRSTLDVREIRLVALEHALQLEAHATDGEVVGVIRRPRTEAPIPVRVGPQRIADTDPAQSPPRSRATATTGPYKP